MKILVISDTHNMIQNAVSLITKLNPDYVIHLGDVCEDSRRLEDMFPRKLIVSVKGNNDYFDNSYPFERCFDIMGKKIFMCHGHKYNVKMSLMNLIYKAKEYEADIVLYGHTHKSHIEEIDGMLVINPGSVGTFALIDITEDLVEARIESYAK